MLAGDRHHPRNGSTINNPSWISNDVKQTIGRRLIAYEAKEEATTKKLMKNISKLGDQ